ncbi:MAG: fibronectin type III domain-containing protein [Mogibacterium sp.]|nr:fibronectin type III domain-containing protein [Mogibacterium sp.]
MTKRSSLMSKFMVLLLAFAVIVTYSVMPMNQAYAASARKPVQVKSLKATATSSSAIKLTWKKAKYAKKYQVYMATSKKGKYKRVATLAASKRTYTKKSLKSGTTYYFKVRALNGKKYGKFSLIKWATTKKVVSEKEPKLGAKKGRTMVTTIDMRDPKYDGKVVKVWVPIAQTDKYQTVEIDEAAVIAGISADKVEINTDSVNGNKMLYIEWGKDTESAKRVATFRYNAERAEVGFDSLTYNSKAAIPTEAKAYISKESEYVKINDPVVKEAAKAAVGKATGTLNKAKAIYDWIIDNLERVDNGETLTNANGETKTFEVDGCGYGDTVKILTDLKTFGRAGGHCTDINSTFVALCRANGIAAREMFGIRLNTDDTSGQHCWTEFYLPGTGWVYADPGDVLKAVKGSNKGMTLDEVKAAKATADKAKFWGKVDNNRIVLSRGRDVTFSPAQAWGPCNTFGYPAAEVDGQRLETSFTDAKNFKYTISCINTVTAAELEASLADGKYKIIDARAVKDYDTAHIPGAISADVSSGIGSADKPATEEGIATANANLDAAIAGDAEGTKYAIICYSGNKYANYAQAYLVSAGVKADNVFILGQDNGAQGPSGGMKAWKGDLVPSAEAVSTETVYVTPQWLKSAMAGEQAGYENLVVLEVSYADPANKTYAKGHVPGAIKAYSIEVEDAEGKEGAFNLLSVDEIQKNLLAKGITADTKVVMYDAAGDPCEVGRQAYGYIVAGVKDVKILDGHLAAWEKAGYTTETKANEAVAASEFGGTPHLEYWTSIEDAKAKLESDPSFKLVSIRSEEEWLGITSGYNYIDYAGEPEGAVWGKGAKTAFDVADFLNEDGTVKDLDGFKAVWEDCNFKTDDTEHLAFYCGTGWRATVPFLVLYENGYKNISVYDGGWYEWVYAGSHTYDDVSYKDDSHKDYPVQVGDPASADCLHTTVGELPSGKAAK